MPTAPLCLQPARIGRMELRNRLVFPPINTNYCDAEGRVTDRFLAYHLARARGGVGLLILEATYIRQDGRGFGNQLGLSSDEHIPGLRRFAEAMHCAGAKVAIQLNHCGRQTSEKITGTTPLSPSISVYNGQPTRPMNEDDIWSVIEDFARAAARAREAGLDAVELHGGNGYLMQQFLSRHTNKRTDMWGGALGNRLRFTREVVRAVRKAVGADFPIIHRLGVHEENASDALTLHEGTCAARLLAQEEIDALDITAGMRECGWVVIPPAAMPLYTHFDKSEAVRTAINAQKPVIGVGRIMSLEMAEHAIQNGKADFVGIGRALLADPDMIEKAKTKKSASIRPCIACNEGCSRRLSSGLDIWCAVNPEMGEEYKGCMQKAAAPRHVVVIGGGPAGMTAALTAAARGHRVTLLEKSGSLGGRLLSAALPPHKEMLSQYIAYLEHAVRQSPVELRLNYSADVQAILDLRPEHVVIAVGSTPFVPQLKGLEKVHFHLAEDVLRKDPAQFEGPIYIIGAGLVGCETGEYLAAAGHDVSLFRRRDLVAADVEPRTRHLLLARLRELGVRIQTRTQMLDIRPDGVEAEICGERVNLPAPGTWVIAAGYVTVQGLAEALRQEGLPVTEAGDCSGGRNILTATRQGFFSISDV